MLLKFKLLLNNTTGEKIIIEIYIHYLYTFTLIQKSLNRDGRPVYWNYSSSNILTFKININKYHFEIFFKKNFDFLLTHTNNF